jgi:hypothetical protein
MNKDLIGNPFDLSEPGDTLQGRLEGENLARGLMDGRKLRRRGRAEQVALKTTLLKRQQLQRLALRMNRSLTEVFEDALDALEEKLNSGKVGK